MRRQGPDTDQAEQRSSASGRVQLGLRIRRAADKRARIDTAAAGRHGSVSLLARPISSTCTAKVALTRAVPYHVSITRLPRTERTQRLTRL